MNVKLGRFVYPFRRVPILFRAKVGNDGVDPERGRGVLGETSGGTRVHRRTPGKPDRNPDSDEPRRMRTAMNGEG